jgi:5-(carboxyamino)imidazole ribonucleotide synthase
MNTPAQQQITIGILGGGQLGRMLAQEANRLGHRVVVRTDESDSPASQVADDSVVGRYRDAALNEQFADMVDVVTVAFENLPLPMLRFFEDRLPVHPSSSAIETCQHREREKLFLRDHRVAVTPFAVATSAEEAVDAFEALDDIAVMKTAAFAHEGKGLLVLQVGDDAAAAFRKIGAERVVMEQWVDFACEICVVGARGTNSSWVSFPPIENRHINGILDVSIAPANISPTTVTAADRLARKIADNLGYVGTIAVEMFVLHDGSLLVNEIAPRPHNSGHHTIESCDISQYGLQIAAITGESFATYGTPGSVPQNHQAVMVNLLGDLWAKGEPNWSVLERPDVTLHLYGKTAPKAARKMGHFTMLNGSVEDASALRSLL